MWDTLGSNHLAGHVDKEDALCRVVYADPKGEAKHELLVDSDKVPCGWPVVGLWLISKEAHYYFDDGPCRAQLKIVVAFLWALNPKLM